MRRVFQSLSILASRAVRWPQKWGPEPNVLELYLDGMIVDEPPVMTMLSRFTPRMMVFSDIIMGLRDAEEDEAIRALMLFIGEHDLGWARAEELREAILQFRAAGKIAVAFIESGGNVDYFIAAACDHIVLAPSGNLDLMGLMSEVLYFKGIIDRLDIKPDLLQAGKYKSAIEPYTRTSMSRAHRENLDALLDSIYDLLIKAIARARGLDESRVRKIVDGGPYLSEAALEKGLIDSVLYIDQVEELLEKMIGTAPERIRLGRYRRLHGQRPDALDPWRDVPRLALIYATGVIHSGESRNMMGMSNSAGSDTLTRALQQVRENDRISAAVMRVDSPGGSGLASDLIWREVSLFKGVKPIIVSMGDVAASGGYYISMTADRILCMTGSITGSIGVIGGKVNLKGLYQKLGLNKEVVTRGKNADLHSDYSSFSPGARKKVKEEIDQFYNIFVQKAAEGRELTKDKVHGMAQGQVWSGEQALAKGLIDEIGGLRKALEAAKIRCGIPVKQKTPVEIFPRQRRISLPSLPWRALPFSPGMGRLLSALETLPRLNDHRFLALMPYQVKIR